MEGPGSWQSAKGNVTDTQVGEKVRTVVREEEEAVTLVPAEASSSGEARLQSSLHLV